MTSRSLVFVGIARLFLSTQVIAKVGQLVHFIVPKIRMYAIQVARNFDNTSVSTNSAWVVTNYLDKKDVISGHELCSKSAVMEINGNKQSDIFENLFFAGLLDSRVKILCHYVNICFSLLSQRFYIVVAHIQVSPRLRQSYQCLVPPLSSHMIV